MIRFHTHYPSCLLSEVNMSLAKDLILCDICLSDILALGFAYAGEWVKDMIRSGTSDFCTAASFHSGRLHGHCTALLPTLSCNTFAMHCNCTNLGLYIFSIYPGTAAFLVYTSAVTMDFLQNMPLSQHLCQESDVWSVALPCFCCQAYSQHWAVE